MAGKIQDADIKSLSQLTGLGADKTQLLNTSKMYSPKSDEVLETVLRKNNLEAVDNPTEANDSSQNYEVGSVWLNSSNGNVFYCIDNTIGAAVWRQSSGGGIGGVDILFVQDFEAVSLSDFTQVGLVLDEVGPLKGVVSAKLVHDDTINQSLKQSVPVGRKFRGLGVTLKLNIKSGASEGNVVINIKDETNNAVLVNSEQLPVSLAVAGTTGTVSFLVPETCELLSYEIIALPEAGAPETIVDDIVAELSTSSLLSTSVEVPVTSKLEDFVPSIGLTGGTLSTQEGKKRRDGEFLEFEANYKWSTIFTGGVPSVPVPDGLSIDLEKIAGGQPANVEINFGSADFYDSSTNLSYQGLVAYSDPNTLLLKYFFNATGNTYPTATNSNITTTLPFQWAANDEITVKVRIPIVGWTAKEAKAIPLAQSVLVNESDSVLYAAGNGGQSITANVTDIPFIFISNKGGDLIWNGDSFSVANDGIYSITGSVRTTASLSRTSLLYEDGVAKYNIGTTNTTTPNEFSTTDYLEAGKIYSIRQNVGGTLQNTPEQHHITIVKQNSIKQVNVNPNSKITIPTSELRMEGVSTRGSVDTAIVRFDSVAKLRGDAFEVISTVESGTKIVMKKKGRLGVSASLALAAVNAVLSISKNQSALTTAPTVASEVMAWTQVYAVGATDSLSSSFDVNVGDVIRIGANSAVTSVSQNQINLSFQEQDIAVSVTNILPQFSDSDSSIRLDTANGFGSGANRIRRFSNIRDNIGEDIEYIDSATDGARFVVKSDGLYNISYSDNYGGDGRHGISKNSTQLEANIESITAESRLSITRSTIGNGDEVCSWSGYLLKGDIIRPHTDRVPGGTPASSSFTISKVGKPNVTGVDVTPFVNIPQPDSQSNEGFKASHAGGALAPTTTSQRGSGIYSYDSITGIYTILKPCEIALTISGAASGGGNNAPFLIILKNNVSISSSSSRATAGYPAAASWIGYANTGDTFNFGSGTGDGHSNIKSSVIAKAASDQIITPSETFSTDKNNLTYAPSSLYTLSTLESAPVGTFITFTYAANGNARTQTTTAPTQTTADMNLNGVRIFTRAHNAASVAESPVAFAIQIGKGLKGKTIDLYKETGKVNSGTLDVWGASGVNVQYGIAIKNYDESTGVLVVDAGLAYTSSVTISEFRFSDITGQTNGYLVINASKSPALIGLPLLQPRIATIKDVKPSGSAGGTAIAGAYRTRDLNTLEDPSGIVAGLASNQFTLEKGEYYIEAVATAGYCDQHKIKIRNITDGIDSIIGSISSTNAATGFYNQSDSEVKGFVKNSSAKIFELQHIVVSTRSTDGFGAGASFGDENVYSQIKITKIRD